MFSLNLANLAISSALAIAPMSFPNMGYPETKQSAEPSQIAPSMNDELRETLLVANNLLETFYSIASKDHSVFERLSKTDFVVLFQQAEQLADILRSKLSDEYDMALFRRYAHTFKKVQQLYEAIEYRKEMDRVLLPRVNSPESTVITKGMSREDIRRALLG